MVYKNYKKNPSWGAVLGGCLVAILLMLGAVALSGLLLMLVWNIVAPVFDWPTLTWLQATGLSLLLGFIGSLFRGVRVEAKS